MSRLGPGTNIFSFMASYGCARQYKLYKLPVVKGSAD